MDERDWLAQRFDEERPHLLAVAYRMLGSLAEAEDAVQETWVRLSRADAGAVENLGGWLTTVVGRVCLNVLRSRATRRENSLETHIAESIATNDERTDPEQEALLADSLGLALLIVLDTLAPPERVAFVLHDMFAVPCERSPRSSAAAHPQHASSQAAHAAGYRVRTRFGTPTGSARPSSSTPSSPQPATETSARCSPSSTLRSCYAPTSKPYSWAQPRRSTERQTSPPSHGAREAPDQRSSTEQREPSGCRPASYASSGASRPAATRHRVGGDCVFGFDRLSVVRGHFFRIGDSAARSKSCSSRGTC